jgi:chemotaxis protein MotB
MTAAMTAQARTGVKDQAAQRGQTRLLRALSGCALTVSMIGAGLGLGGCQGGNTALIEANRALTDRNTALTQQVESLQSLVNELQAGLSARDKALMEQTALINDLRSGKSGLEGQIGSLQSRIEGMNFGNLAVQSALDPSTDQALKDLAARYSDILEYDSARGVLRFKSDVTFDSGSDALRGEARSTLRVLAGILNSSAAQYDVRVVGHTDSQRLSANTRQRHSTNLRLSCDRAISVRNELVGQGVTATRFEVGGQGEFNPRTPNRGNGNTPENRRVEVFLVKATPKVDVGSIFGNDAGGGGAMAPAAPARPAARSTDDDVMK